SASGASAPCAAAVAGTKSAQAIAACEIELKIRMLSSRLDGASGGCLCALICCRSQAGESLSADAPSWRSGIDCRWGCPIEQFSLSTCRHRYFLWADRRASPEAGSALSALACASHRSAAMKRLRCQRPSACSIDCIGRVTACGRLLMACQRLRNGGPALYPERYG